MFDVTGFIGGVLGLESPDDTLTNPAHNPRIRERLMRWLFTRPSMGDLEKKGYIKGTRGLEGCVCAVGELGGGVD